MGDLTQPSTWATSQPTSLTEKKTFTTPTSTDKFSPSSSSSTSNSSSSSPRLSASSSPPSSSASDTDTTPDLEPSDLSSLDLPAFNLSQTHLISSPYPDAANQLTLHGLDLPNRLFAFALTALHPVREDYATAPYLEAFNWDEVFAYARKLGQEAGYTWPGEQAFYVVIFRSCLQPDIDRERLGELDQRSHEEACASGGLLKYWFGRPNAERRNLATCLWRSHADAVAGGKGPWHAQARAAARHMYERIDFLVHRLVVEEGAASWRLEEFVRS